MTEKIRRTEKIGRFEIEWADIPALPT